jgi:hypothetical protein
VNARSPHGPGDALVSKISRMPFDEAGIAGELNSITDITGIRVGHATRRGEGALTGTTVILLPPGSVTSVDVRGGAPATRDTAALDPVYGNRNADVFVLTGGSAYGLSAAHGVLTWLSEQDSRFDELSVIPAAAVFDLGRGGAFHAHPGPEVGAEAAQAAAASGEHSPVAQGNVGAGTGAVNAEIKGVGDGATTSPQPSTDPSNPARQAPVHQLSQPALHLRIHTTARLKELLRYAIAIVVETWTWSLVSHRDVLRKDQRHADNESHPLGAVG